MDWAGTAVDYGCFAPVAAFLLELCRKGNELLQAKQKEILGDLV